MKQHNSLLDRLMDTVDLVDEPLPRIPIVELSDDRRVLIENHCGISEYGKECMKVRVRYGEVCICGQCLLVSRLNGKQLIITGRIDSISVVRRQKR